MLDILIKSGAAANAREDAWNALQSVDQDPDGASPMLAEKLLADASLKLVSVAQDFIAAADECATQRARLLREHPESFGARR